MVTDIICSYLAQQLGSFLVGAASSAAVAYLFYRVSRRDSESLHRQAQLDSVSIRLKQLDPRSWPDNYRGHWGVDNIVHWMTCMAEQMREQGFADGEAILQEIIAEMLEVCPGADQTSSLTKEQAEARKKEWEGRIRKLSGIQPRSFLSRSDGARKNDKQA